MTEAGKDAESIEHTAALWLARTDAAPHDDALRTQRDAWVNADLRHRLAYLRLRAAWEHADLASDDAAAGAALHRTTAPRSRRHAPWAIAAALVLGCAVPLLATVEPAGHAYRTYATGIGENRTIALEDGSRLTLNTGTRLRAASGERKVWLEHGEAYFDVAHDPGHPFVIEMGQSRVIVLGTRFTVRRDDGATRVMVAQGRVRLSTEKASVELTPDQEADVQDGRIAASTHSTAQTDRALAWREGRIVFDRTTLADAVAEFNRYNERKLVVAGPAAGQVLIGGSFAPTNIDGFVRMLEQGFGIRAKRRSAQITLTN